MKLKAKNNIKIIKGVVNILLSKKSIFFIIVAIILSIFIYFIFFKETKTYNGVFVYKIFSLVGDNNGYLC